MQCKDIPTKPILIHLASFAGIWCLRNSGDERDIRHAMPNGFELPTNLILAKMRKLILAGLVDGCACGCRGDFRLTPKGLAELATEPG